MQKNINHQIIDLNIHKYVFELIYKQNERHHYVSLILGYVAIDSRSVLLYPRYRYYFLMQFIMATSQFQLSGLTCESCVKLIKRKLGKLNGVIEVNLDIDGETEIIADQPISKEMVVTALAGTHYQVL